MSTINFNTALKDIDENDIEQYKMDKGQEKVFCNECKKNITTIKTTPYILTLKRICVDALMAPDKEKDGQKKIDKLELALKINGSEDKIDLKPEQIVNLRDLIVKTYDTPLIVARSWQLLENE